MILIVAMILLFQDLLHLTIKFSINAKIYFLSENKNEFENGFILYKGGNISDEFKGVAKYHTYELFKEMNVDFFKEKNCPCPNPYTGT